MGPDELHRNLTGNLGQEMEELNLKGRSWLLSALTATSLFGIGVTPAQAFSRPPATHSYIIRPGDTMYVIAKRFHIQLASLEKANPAIKDFSLVYPGQKLNIPQGYTPHVASRVSHVQHPTKTPTASASNKRQQSPKTDNVAAGVINSAFALRGIHYAWGGTSPKTGFDCSGFIQYIFRIHGISLPRTASAQANVGKPVPLDKLQPGDLLFFVDTYANHLSNQVTHVALYIGNGNVIESSSVHNQGVVVLHNLLQNPWYKTRYYGARNVF